MRQSPERNFTVKAWNGALKASILRPSSLLLAIIILILAVDLFLLLNLSSLRKENCSANLLMAAIVEGYGLSDLAVATEARYTRHPAVSDPMAPFMDHPGAFEHFPTGSFWRPVLP